MMLIGRSSIVSLALAPFKLSSSVVFIVIIYYHHRYQYRNKCFRKINTPTLALFYYTLDIKKVIIFCDSRLPKINLSTCQKNSKSNRTQPHNIISYALESFKIPSKKLSKCLKTISIYYMISRRLK